MSDEVKKSDTELAVEFIERGQNALGQANVTILVRPEKLMEKIEKEIEKVRIRIRELQEQIRQIPVVDRNILDMVSWQQSQSSYNLLVKAQVAEEIKRKKYDLQIQRRRDIESDHKQIRLNSGYDKIVPPFTSMFLDARNRMNSEQKAELEASRRDLDKSESEHKEAQKELAAAQKEHEFRTTDLKYSIYVAERQKAITEAETSRDTQVAVLSAEIGRQEKRIEKFQEYISLLIERAIGSI